jgi:hypothetical protein
MVQFPFSQVFSPVVIGRVRACVLWERSFEALSTLFAYRNKHLNSQLQFVEKLAFEIREGSPYITDLAMFSETLGHRCQRVCMTLKLSGSGQGFFSPMWAVDLFS